MVVEVGQARMAPLAVHAQEELRRAARRLQPRAVARSAGAATGAGARPASCASLTRPQLRAQRSVFAYISGHTGLMRPAAAPPPAPDQPYANPARIHSYALGRLSTCILVAYL